ncbi:MAG: hypothetical protein WEA58_11455 [Balneolaceae bacterium]
MRKLLRISEALPQCYLSESAGAFTITDKHGEVVGEINIRKNSLLVHSDYKWHKKVMKSLKRKGLDAQLKPKNNTDDIIQVLYGELT